MSGLRTDPVLDETIIAFRLVLKAKWCYITNT